MNLRFRPATPADLRFVAHSWFESYRRGGGAPQVRFDTYKAGQGALIDRLLAAAPTTVAFNPIEPDEICGWMCGDRSTIHFVYVKQAYRRMGIARALVSPVLAAGPAFTHATRIGTSLASRAGLSFNPYLLSTP